MNDEFIEAIKNNDIERVKTLLQDKGVDPSAYNNIAIIIAAMNGYTEIVKILLKDKRVDPSAWNNQAIRYAAENGRMEVVRLLLRDGRADPSTLDNYAIRYAARQGHSDVVKILLQDGRVDPSTDDNAPIREAVLHGRTEVVKILLKDPRVDPSAENNHAIKWAIFYGRTEIVKLLLEDPRVDWRVVKDKPIVKDLLKQQDKELRDQYINSYLSLKKSVTKTLDLDPGQTTTKPLLKRKMIEQLSYRGIYEELCSSIPPNIKIPPMKLIALANALNIQYDFNNINWTELCAKVKASLNLVIFH